MDAARLGFTSGQTVFSSLDDPHIGTESNIHNNNTNVVVIL